MQLLASVFHQPVIGVWQRRVRLKARNSAVLQDDLQARMLMDFEPPGERLTLQADDGQRSQLVALEFEQRNNVTAGALFAV